MYQCQECQTFFSAGFVGISLQKTCLDQRHRPKKPEASLFTCVNNTSKIFLAVSTAPLKKFVSIDDHRESICWFQWHRPNVFGDMNNPSKHFWQGGWESIKKNLACCTTVASLEVSSSCIFFSVWPHTAFAISLFYDIDYLFLEADTSENNLTCVVDTDNKLFAGVNDTSPKYFKGWTTFCRCHCHRHKIFSANYRGWQQPRWKPKIIHITPQIPHIKRNIQYIQLKIGKSLVQNNLAPILSKFFPFLLIIM